MAVLEGMRAAVAGWGDGRVRFSALVTGRSAAR